MPDIYVERLIARLSGNGDRPCLRYRGLDVPASQLLDSIFRYARALADLGIGTAAAWSRYGRRTARTPSPSAMPPI